MNAHAPARTDRLAAARRVLTAASVAAALTAAASVALPPTRTGPAAVAAEPAGAAADAGKFFETEVRPILATHCFSCHGAEKKVKGKFNITTREGLVKGGTGGPALDEANPAGSLVLHALNGTNDVSQMPPKGKLPAAQLETLTKWVKMGAPYGPPAGSTTAPKTGDAHAHHGPPPVDEKARNWWAFRPVSRPAVPEVKDKGWVRSPVDAFVLSGLEAKGWKPAPAADKATLIRRAYYTVTGLPPTPAEVDAFLADSAPDAFEKVVDKLLASRHRGEHWARLWLDLVRYAESNSYERDDAKPNAWKFRDYVIRSFNEDKPYDRFVREQLAGDEIAPDSRDALIATGYYLLGIWDDEPADKHERNEDLKLSVFDWYDDVVSTTGQTFLGLTVGCARCHDHKIDPLPQKDYYKMLAFVRNIRMYSPGPGSQRPLSGEAELARHKEAVSAWQKRLDAVNAELAGIEKAVAEKLVAGEKDDFRHESNRAAIVRKHAGGLVSKEDAARHKELRRQRDELNRARPVVADTALAVSERGTTPRETFVLGRGMPANKGDKVEPGFPAVLTAADAPPPTIPAAPPAAKSTGRRTALADWITDAKNPLTARVMANRIFQHVFGRGIVRSPSNFGYMGAPPTHPELLDYLATELVAGGWRIRPVERMLLVSSAFRMASNAGADPSYATADPENDRLWRYDARRMTSEEIRDSILAASGNLNLKKAEGPSVYPVIPPEVLAGQSRPGHGWGKSTAEEAASRSVFVFVKRSLAVPQLAVFDTPDPDSPCPARFTTTQPTQALVMINSAFINDQARLYAESVAKEAGAEPAAQVTLALRRAVQRPPTATEIERGVRFLAEVQAKDKVNAAEALRRYCLVMLNLNEAVFID
jgi:mono/diheme cytochrome c family protein